MLLKSLRRSPYVMLLLWVLPLVGIRSAQQSLMAFDEGFYALIAKTFLFTGDWITPQWSRELVFDRTIGIQWLIGICYTLFGVNEGATRLPSAIAWIASVLLTYKIGTYLLPPRIALWGAAIFSVIPLVVQYGRLGTQDMMLVCVELLAIWAVLLTEQRRVWGVMAGACFGIAFLIKGFMAIPAAIALIPYLIKQRHLLNPWLYLGLMVGAIPPAAWLWAASAKHGSIVLQMMVGKMFILGSETWMDAGPTYYFWNVPANGFPWVFLALGGGVLLLRQARSAIANWLLIGYPVVLFVELTLFRTRTHYYPLQLMPFVGLLAAIALHHLMEKYRDRQGLLTILHGVLGSLGLLLLGASIWILGFSPFDPAIKPIAGVVLILSLGWLWICAIWYFRQSAQGWGAAWLVTSWLALAMLNATSWGNYAPQLKTFLEQPQVAQVLRSHPIKFVLDPKTQRPSDFETYVLLSFYTLQPSIEASLTQLSPQDFAWVDPIQQSAIPPNMTRISTFRNWTLVQR